MPQNLREKLERAGGVRNIEFMIPHMFLPPRFKKISEGRNMILLVDPDLVSHVRWEGSLQDEFHPLRRKAVQKLIDGCVARMKDYRSDLGVFSRFIERRTEEPFWDPRVDSLAEEREPKSAEGPSEPKGVVATVKAEPVAEGESDFSEEGGGENPLPADVFNW